MMKTLRGPADFDVMSTGVLNDLRWSGGVIPCADAGARLQGELGVAGELPDLRGAPDAVVFRWAAEAERRIVTENVKDFRPLLLLQGSVSGNPVAPLLLVPPRRFPRGQDDRAAAIVRALDGWLTGGDAAPHPVEDWLPG